MEESKRRAKRFSEKLEDQRRKIAEERKTVLEAVNKLAKADKRLNTKIREFEEIALVK